MIITVTGGSGSGKSEYAEKYVSKLEGKKYYLATMLPSDKETDRKIQRHKEMRKSGDFQTIEKYTSIGELDFNKDDIVLLECVSNLLANEMYAENGAGEKSVENIIKGIEKIAGQARCTVIVTNEVFSDLSDYSEESIKYIKNLGEINFQLSKISDEVYEVVYGIPIMIKGDKK